MNWLGVTVFLLFMSTTSQANMGQCRRFFEFKKTSLIEMGTTRAAIALTGQFPIANQAQGRVFSWYLVSHGFENSLRELLQDASLKRISLAATARHKDIGFDRDITPGEAVTAMMGLYYRGLAAVATTLVNLDGMSFARNPYILEAIELYTAPKSMTEPAQPNFNPIVIAQAFDAMMREYPQQEVIAQLKSQAQQLVDIFGDARFVSSSDAYVNYIATGLRHNWEGPGVEKYVGFDNILDFAIVRAMKGRGASEAEILQLLGVFRTPDRPELNLEKINEFATDFNFQPEQGL